MRYRKNHGEGHDAGRGNIGCCGDNCCWQCDGCRSQEKDFTIDSRSAAKAFDVSHRRLLSALGMLLAIDEGRNFRRIVCPGEFGSSFVMTREGMLLLGKLISMREGKDQKEHANEPALRETWKRNGLKGCLYA